MEKPFNVAAFPEYNDEVWLNTLPEVRNSFANMKGAPSYSPFMPEGNTYDALFPERPYKIFNFDGNTFDAPGYPHSEELAKLARTHKEPGLYMSNIIERPSMISGSNSVGHNFLIGPDVDRVSIWGNTGALTSKNKDGSRNI